MKRLQFLAAVAAAFLWLPGSMPADAGANSDAQQLDRLFPRSTLQIATPDARLHKIDVWVADNDARRARGLMFVEQLAEGTGMLFVSADGRVQRVVENTTPMSLDTISSGGTVLGVIELKAGSAARMKIRAGAQVIHPAFSLN